MPDRKSILITGCSDGSLGSALALALQKLNWRVIASSRNLSKLGAMQAAGIECVLMDVGSDQSVAAAVDEIARLTGGSLDGLVNNAGGGGSSPVIHIDNSQAHQMFELNVFSIIRVTRDFLPLLLRSTRRPIIANNTSGSALLGCSTAFQGLYGASKAAAASITENLRVELDPFGVRVVNLVTGGIKTTFHQNAPQAILPAESIYNIAKEDIESTMNGNERGIDKSNPEDWARQVAADLSSSKPPFMIYRGAKAGTAKLATLLPTGTADKFMKQVAGVDVLEKRLKEQKASKVVKRSN